MILKRENIATREESVVFFFSIGFLFLLSLSRKLCAIVEMCRLLHKPAFMVLSYLAMILLILTQLGCAASLGAYSVG